MNKLPEKPQTVYAGLDLAKATLGAFGQALAPAPTPMPDATWVKRRELVHWRAQVEKLVRLDGVRLITAVTTLSEMPELVRLNQRPAAALAGLAPWTRQSGPWEGQRHIGGGRSQVRQGLDMGAVALARMPQTVLGRFDQRLRLAGQPAKVALTAVMRKLLLHESGAQTHMIPLAHKHRCSPPPAGERAGVKGRFMPDTKPPMPTRLLGLACALAALAGAAGAPPPATLTVEAARPGAPISPTMWGVFFEDINFGADGGLYAELIKNRAFEFPDPLMGWTILRPPAGAGSAQGLDQDPCHPANPRYLRLTAGSAGDEIGVANEGFRGLGLRAGERYRFSVVARAVTGRPALRIELADTNGAVLAHTTLKRFAPDWRRQTATLRATVTEPKARLVLRLTGPGTLDLDLVSLFPANTWRGRANMLRADLVQMLADLKPGFVRFPGGCIVEGRYLTNRYQWKNTLGPPAARRLLINRWNDEFQHRPAPDYFQSFGLGFFEYFLLCEDLGAEPLPILNCGMACQFNSGELAPLDQLEPYIQDALDLIEFANGAPSTPWGGRRAALGHPKPFNLKFLGIGNEQWGPAYFERYAAFARALKARHPDIRLVASAGPAPDDARFHEAWPRLRALGADIVDEHCYARPDWFLDNTTRYDRYERAGPKVLMGEYAAQSDKTVSVSNRNDWACALAEAAYMIGLERNADLVVMASYAPLLAHAQAWQWRPNLIWFDPLGVFGTPSYYVQQLFSRHRGDRLLPVQLTGAPLATNGQPRLYASAARDERAGEIILKVVNASAQMVETAVTFAGVTKIRPGTGTLLTAPSLTTENSFEAPRRVAPVTHRFEPPGPAFRYCFPARSVTVLRVRAAR